MLCVLRNSASLSRVYSYPQLLAVGLRTSTPIRLLPAWLALDGLGPKPASASPRAVPGLGSSENWGCGTWRDSEVRSP